MIILLLALVILGPDKLPDAMRRAGRMWAELRKLSTGFQEEVRKGFDEPTRELRETAKTVTKAASFATKPVKGSVKSFVDSTKPQTAKMVDVSDGGDGVPEEPVDADDPADTPVAEEPVADEPAADEPVAEEPVADEPATDEPVADEPAAEEPAAANSDVDADDSGATNR